jgi:hypothetical protein
LIIAFADVDMSLWWKEACISRWYEFEWRFGSVVRSKPLIRSVVLWEGAKNKFYAYKVMKTTT